MPIVCRSLGDAGEGVVVESQLSMAATRTSKAARPPRSTASSVLGAERVLEHHADDLPVPSQRSVSARRSSCRAHCRTEKAPSRSAGRRRRPRTPGSSTGGGATRPDRHHERQRTSRARKCRQAGKMSPPITTTSRPGDGEHTQIASSPSLEAAAKGRPRRPPPAPAGRYARAPAPTYRHRRRVSHGRVELDQRRVRHPPRRREGRNVSCRGRRDGSVCHGDAPLERFAPPAADHHRASTAAAVTAARQAGSGRAGEAESWPL